MKFFFIPLLAILLLNFDQSLRAQSKTETLTNKSVIDLHKAGLGDDVIISSIATSTCKFDVSSAGLIELKKQKLSDELIKNMIDKASNKSMAANAAPEPVAAGKNAAGKADVVKSSGLNITLLNHVHVYENNQAKPLEKATAGMRTKQGMFSGSALWEIEGSSSSVRLPVNGPGSFVINTGSSALPEMVLYRVKSAKGKREVATMKVGSFSGVKTGQDVVPVDISKIKEGIYQLTPSKKLDKGEYFFAAKAAAGEASMQAFAFGVD